MSTPPFGLVIPVRNEAAALSETLPALLSEMKGLPARPVWVCNGCIDESVQVIRTLAGRDAEIIELSRPGKTGALQAGDDTMDGLFPRFYLDADIILSPGALPALLRPLVDGRADLVAARRIHAANCVSALSAAMARTWDALPYARQGFGGVVGVSEAGRTSWERWPDILGDDIFMAASIAPHRRVMVPQVTASTRPPADFTGWVRMRARWLQGEAELRGLGLEAPKVAGQRNALLRRMLTPSIAPGAVAFAAARLLAPLARDRAASGWHPDRNGWS
ncbi:glycosyltransferase [Roseovarius sp. D22-M7]|uniref:glycosyltransferase n=1 Tax=Roseovarius sp. D22-M7 TaxID=3127116 RepID=UPI00300FC781